MKFHKKNFNLYVIVVCCLAIEDKVDNTYETTIPPPLPPGRGDEGDYEDGKLSKTIFCWQKLKLTHCSQNTYIDLYIPETYTMYVCVLY